MRKPAACFTCLLMVCSTAYAQYASDFEALTASAGGEVLTGQDGYYIPQGTDSIDALAYTYAGNVLGIPQNPGGGEQFIAGEGPGSPTFSRAQRDIDWGMGTSTWTVSYDVLALHTQNAPGQDNIGSFSGQPFPGSNSYIHLIRWVLDSTTNWENVWVAYFADGTQFPFPYGAGDMGPAFTNLELNH